jgi:chromate transporter
MGHGEKPGGAVLLEIAGLCLRLGFTAFGGPAAHIAMLQDEVVDRRKWMTRDEFLDLLGLSNLIPGPTSTQTVINCGRVRGGFPGLCVAGVCFILPAALITGVIAWAYVRFGSLPEAGPILYGVKPAVVAIIFVAVAHLARQAAKAWQLVIVGLGVLASYLMGVNPILGLLAGAVIGMLWLRMTPRSGKIAAPAVLLAAIATTKSALAAGSASAAAKAVPLWKLGVFFLKIAFVLFGGGYILVAFLHGGLVVDNKWLTQEQLLDAIAVGQFTPGPVFSAATFIGYVIDGVPGAAVATLGIFLPSFLLIAALSPLLPRMRKSPWTGAFLDAVNMSAVGLMAAVTIGLAVHALTRWPAWVIFALATICTLRFKVNTAWIVLGGALLGLAAHACRLL